MAVVYGAISLRASMRAAQEKPTSTWTDPQVAGLLSGAIGTTFGALASLPIAMHFDAIRMQKDCFRATMSMILVLIGLFRGLGYVAVGEFRREVLLVLLFTLPMALIGIFFGDRLHTGMSDIAFGRLVSVSLIISGFALLVMVMIRTRQDAAGCQTRCWREAGRTPDACYAITVDGMDSSLYRRQPDKSVISIRRDDHVDRMQCLAARCLPGAANGEPAGRSGAQQIS